MFFTASSLALLYIRECIINRWATAKTSQKQCTDSTLFDGQLPWTGCFEQHQDYQLYFSWVRGWQRHRSEKHEGKEALPVPNAWSEYLWTRIMFGSGWKCCGLVLNIWEAEQNLQVGTSDRWGLGHISPEQRWLSPQAAFLDPAWLHTSQVICWNN